MLPMFRSFGPRRDYSNGMDDSGPTAMPATHAAPITKSNTGNAALDGYTVMARRLRGDPAGDMIDASTADAIESGGPLNDY